MRLRLGGRGCTLVVVARTTRSVDDTNHAMALSHRRRIGRIWCTVVQRLHIRTRDLWLVFFVAPFPGGGTGLHGGRHWHSPRHSGIDLKDDQMLNKFFALLVTALGGMLFGFGLALSTMVSPEVVLSFLQLQDFGLMLVMGGAVAVTLVAYQLAPRLLKRPLFGGTFATREAQLDLKTLVGAAIFGLGWGICGVCPGPAIASLGVGNLDMLWALTGILVGAYAQGLLADILDKARNASD